MASEFYLVLPSNSSMVTHPNNTLAKYIINLPRRISLSGNWECGLTEIHYPHDWYNVRNAGLTVEHDDNVEMDAYFEDGYYDSPKALANKLSGDKPGRVKFSYEPVTQKFVAKVKSETTFTLYGDLRDILGFGAGTGDSSSTRLASSTNSMVFTRLLHRRFEARFRIAMRLFEHRRTAHRRRQDCIAATNSADNRKPRGDGEDPFRPRPVHSRAESRIRQRRNRDKGRHGPTSAIRRWEGDGDASLSTVHLRVIQMNSDEYYARQVGGALPFFTGARVQRGNGFGRLSSCLLRTVAPLIRRGAVALGKGALTTGAPIAGDVVAGKNVKKAGKRRATAAGRNILQSLLNTPPPPRKRVMRIKRTHPVAVSLPSNDDSEHTCFRNMAFVH